MRCREYGEKRGRFDRPIFFFFIFLPDPVLIDFLVNLLKVWRVVVVVAIVGSAGASLTALGRSSEPRRAVAGREWRGEGLRVEMPAPLLRMKQRGKHREGGPFIRGSA